MSRTIKTPDGVTHIFPDAATDEQISEALNPKPSEPEKKPSVYQQAVGALTNAAGPIPEGDELPFSNAVGPHTKAAMNTPLGHPTGVDLIDQFTSPANLAFMAMNFSKPAAGAAIKGLSALADTISPDAVGIVSPRLASAMRIATRLKAAQAAPPVPSTPNPNPQMAPRLAGKAPAMSEALQSILDELRQQPEAQSSPTALPDYPQAANDTMRALKEQRGPSLSAPDAAPQKAKPLHQAMADVIAESAPKPADIPAPQQFEQPVPPAPNAMSPQRVLNELALAARRAKVTIPPEEYPSLVEAVNKGASPVDAVASRMPSSFSQLPTTADVKAKVAARNSNGQWEPPQADMIERVQAGAPKYQPPATPRLIEKLQTEMNTQSPKLKLSSEEYQAGLDMMRLGLTPEQVRVSIQAQRALLGR